MNNTNLTPFTPETARLAASKSHEARRRNKTFKDLANLLLDQKSDDSDFSNRELIVRNAVDSAKQGDARARKWLENITREKQRNHNPERRKLKNRLLYAGVPEKYLPDNLLPSEEDSQFLNTIADRAASEHAPQGKIYPQTADFDFHVYEPTPPKYDFEAENIRHQSFESRPPIPDPEPYKLPAFYYEKDPFSFTSSATDPEEYIPVSITASKNQTIAPIPDAAFSGISCSLSQDETRRQQYNDFDLVPLPYEPTAKTFSTFYAGTVKESLLIKKKEKIPENESTNKNPITNTPPKQLTDEERRKAQGYKFVLGAGWIKPADPRTFYTETTPIRQHPVKLFDPYEDESSSAYDNQDQPEQIIPPEENAQRESEENTRIDPENKNSSRYSHAIYKNHLAPTTLSARIPMHAVHVSYVVNSPEDIENKERLKAESYRPENMVDTFYNTLHAAVFPNCSLSIVDFIARNFVLNLLDSSPKHIDKALNTIREIEEQYNARHPEEEITRYYWLDHNGVRLSLDELVYKKDRISKTGVIQQLLNWQDDEDDD